MYNLKLLYVQNWIVLVLVTGYLSGVRPDINTDKQVLQDSQCKTHCPAPDHLLDVFWPLLVKTRLVKRCSINDGSPTNSPCMDNCPPEVKYALKGADDVINEVCRVNMTGKPELLAGFRKCIEQTQECSPDDSQVWEDLIEVYLRPFGEIQCPWEALGLNPSKLKRGQAVDRQKQPERRMPKQVTEKPAPGNQPRTEKPAGFPDPDIVDFPAIVKSAKSGGSSCFTTLPCAVIRSLLLLFHLLASLRA